MSRRYPFVVLLASGVVAFAQPAASPASNAPAAVPAAATPSAPRAVSPATADLLKASLPKTALVKPAVKKPEIESRDLREPDKPQNEIVRLPAFMVRERKPPVFREQDIYTREAFARRLAKRYYSEGGIALARLLTYATLGLVPISPEASALAQFREEERLREMGEFAERTNWVMKTDPATGAKMRELGRDMFLHWSDMGWQGGTPK